MSQTKTLLEYYNKTKKELTTRQIIGVIDAMCTAEYPRPSAKFEKQIIEFVEQFKKDNIEYFTKNQDSIVFRMYADIVKNAVEKRQKEIHNAISKEDKEKAKKFAKNIFGLKKDMVYVINIAGKTYMEQLSSEKALAKHIEFSLYAKNAVILFYAMQDAQKLSFGFTVNNGNIVEIDENQLTSNASQKDIMFSTFTKINGKSLDI